MIELGYDILEEKESEATNFILIAQHRRERPGVLINIVSPKSRGDLIIVHSTNIMTGEGAEAFHRLKPETLTSLRNVMNKNALLANLIFKYDITKDKIEVNISDDIVTDGLIKDRLYNITKHIAAFYEFMGHVYREHGTIPYKNSDKTLT
jgi:hypothetical protein